MFFTLFGAVALVGAVGAASMQVLKGPVRTMAEVTKRTVAENNMIASTKLAIIGSANQVGADCDADGFIEPIEPEDPGVNPAPAGGGYLPASIGAALNDPWDTRFSLCSWDHGAAVAKCAGTKPLLQTGGPIDNQYALAVISAGPDRIFQTACNAFVDTTPADGAPDTQLLVKTPGSDDIVLGYTYAEANNIGGGLWALKDGDNTKATIAKDIEVRNAADTDTIFALDRTTGQAEFMAIKTDNLYAKKTPNGTIQIQDIIRAKGFENLTAPSGGGGGAADNLGNHIATMNLKFFATAGGAGISGAEVDPQVGTLTNAKWCTTNGTAINCTSDAPSAVDDTPAAFTFTAQTNVGLDTVISSNTVTITGLGTAGIAVSASGAGSPQISIGGGAWTSGGVIANGQTLQVRQTSANTITTLRTATVTVGTVSATFDVTTTSSDPYFSNVLLLLHGDGANNGTTFTDHSSYNRTMTRVVTNSTPVTSTAQSKFGGASGYFNYGRMTTPYTADWVFGTQNLTIEAWVRYDSFTNSPTIFTRAFSGNTYFILYVDTTGRARIGLNHTSGPLIQSSVPMSTNTWYHLAFVRDGNVWNIYQDGVNVASVTYAFDMNSTNGTAIGIGGYGHADLQNMTGYIDDLRVTKGTARYTANFTPPTSAFLNQ